MRTGTEWAQGLVDRYNDRLEAAGEELSRELRAMRKACDDALVAVEAGNQLPGGFDFTSTASKIANADAERIGCARTVREGLAFIAEEEGK